MQLLWRYNQEAVTMRIQFLMDPDRRAESCTVLVRDIPGVYYGTVGDRIERTALRFLPSIVKRKIVVRLSGPNDLCFTQNPSCYNFSICRALWDPPPPPLFQEAFLQ